MGGSQISKVVKEEQTSWQNHKLTFNKNYNKETTTILDGFAHSVTAVEIAYTSNMMLGLAYKHYYVTLVTARKHYYVEFQGTLNSDALVVLRNERFGEGIRQDCIDAAVDVGNILLRVRFILGMNNYSLVLRNCEHVANYVMYGAWYSSQAIAKNLGNPFAYYCAQCNLATALVNSAPDGFYEVGGGSEEHMLPLMARMKEGTYHITYESADRTGSKITRDTFVAVFLGATGSGKSNLINWVFNNRVADSKRSVTSVSVEVIFYYGRFSGLGMSNRPICLVDTIGFGDTKIPERDLINLLSSKISLNCKHFNKVIVVGANRVDPHHMSNLKDVMKSVGCQGHQAVHLALTYYEGQSVLARSQACAEALARPDISENFCESNAKVDSAKGPYEVKRADCFGFPDKNVLRFYNQDGINAVLKDRLALILMVMYPQKNILPKPIWSSCVIL